MKQLFLLLTAVVIFVFINGCTRIASMEPTSGPPGTPVRIECTGMWGQPSDYCVKWDGKTIRDSFSGSFTVPNDCRVGKHTVTIWDNIDICEVCLIFPLFRLRHDSQRFVVTEPWPELAALETGFDVLGQR